jgi:predicted nuclease of predicted toxin-antitoxin system
MARFYTNENFRKRVVEALRLLGHDDLTSFDAGNANQGISDEDVVRYASQNDRIVLTFNRLDFTRIHKQNKNHSGIIVCTDDKDNNALAQRINEVVSSNKSIDNQLFRVNRPNV